VLAARKRLDEVYAAYGEPTPISTRSPRNKPLEAVVFAQDGDNLDQQLEIAADALRLPPWDAKIGPLSGGEKRRVALCRLLLSKPDMLLLDEPTNHLDAESVEWLEQFLQRFPGTVVAVTHDRYFLDNAAEWILELDRGRGIPWKGNYSSWLDQKQQRLAQEEATESARQKALKRELEWVRSVRRAAHKEQEPHRALRGALELRIPAPQRDPRDLHPGRRASRRSGDRVLGRAQSVRRPAADGRRELQAFRPARSSASSDPTAPARRRSSG
jgi:sulfate-transporting ATPase